MAWALRLPTLPVGVAARHYRGPGFRVLVNVRHIVDVTSNQAGNAVREGLDAGGRAVGWVERHLIELPVGDGVPRTGGAGRPSDGRVRARSAATYGAAPTATDDNAQDTP